MEAQGQTGLFGNINKGFRKKVTCPSVLKYINDIYRGFEGFQG